MSSVDRSIPLSVLGGAAIIAIAIFFGLRGRAPDPPTPVVAPKPMERSAIDSAVRAALEAQKPLFDEKCWAPSAKTTPLPAKSTYVFDLATNELGQEVARGISETEGSRADVAQCLRLVFAPVAVAPTHQRTTTRVRIELP